MARVAIGGKSGAIAVNAPVGAATSPRFPIAGPQPPATVSDRPAGFCQASVRALVLRLLQQEWIGAARQQNGAKVRKQQVQPPDQFQAVHLRQLVIDDCYAERLDGRGFQSQTRVTNGGDIISVADERTRKQVSQVGIVLDDQ
jgi:hypothetical protein